MGGGVPLAGLTVLIFMTVRPSITESIDTCGWLRDRDGCIIFTPMEPCEDYLTDLTVLPDSLAWQPIRIQGELTECTFNCHGYTFPACISGAVIGACEPVDLGCGVLDEDTIDFCHLWVSPIHGRLHASLNGYGDGDTVRAVGIIDRCSVSTCMGEDGGLIDESYCDCPDGVPAVESITWGKVKTLYK